MPSRRIQNFPCAVSNTKNQIGSPARPTHAKLSGTGAALNVATDKTITPRHTTRILVMIFSFGGAVRCSQFTTIQRIITQIPLQSETRWDDGKTPVGTDRELRDRFLTRTRTRAHSRSRTVREHSRVCECGPGSSP